MAEQKRDYYEVLGISKGATEDEIKKAYRKMAKETHPDLHPGDETAAARFKEVNEAYGVLSDKEKKARYDQYGHAGVDPNFGAGGGFDGGFGGGRRANPNAPQRGESLRLSLSIDFEEAAFGCEKAVTLERAETCETCHGSGSAPGSAPETCTECHGTGTVQVRRQTPMGVFATTSPCSKCGGKGKIIRQPCSECHGSGSIRRRRTIHLYPGSGQCRQERRACRRPAHYHQRAASSPVPAGGHVHSQRVPCHLRAGGFRGGAGSSHH